MRNDCLYCGESFTPKINRLSPTGFTRYCSVSCSNKRPISESTRFKMREARLGKKPWNKGIEWEQSRIITSSK